MIKRSSFLEAYYLEVHSWSAEGCKAEIPFLHNHFPEWSAALRDKMLQLGWQMVERHFDRMRGAMVRNEKERQYIKNKNKYVLAEVDDNLRYRSLLTNKNFSMIYRRREEFNPE